MDWITWVSRVLDIARSRGIPATVTFDAPGMATFRWDCPHGVDYRGTAGAGVSMIHLTSPEEFTRFWYCPPAPIQAPTLTAPTPAPSAARETGPQLDPWNRRGVFVPRVPARAVSLALEALKL